VTPAEINALGREIVEREIAKERGCPMSCCHPPTPWWLQNTLGLERARVDAIKPIVRRTLKQFQHTLYDDGRPLDDDDRFRLDQLWELFGYR
jgi:hypothetical protein